MSLASNVLFLVCAAFAFVGALVTISARRPLRSAVGLLVNIISLAGIYLTLSAELLAALQLLVYAGAVVVLFIFVIMLIGPDAGLERTTHMVLPRLFSLMFMVIVGFTLAFAVGHFQADLVRVPDGFGGVEGVGRALYRDAAVPFELVSVTLLIAIIGAVAVARGRTPSEAAEVKRQKSEREAAASRLADDNQASA